MIFHSIFFYGLFFSPQRKKKLKEKMKEKSIDSSKNIYIIKKKKLRLLKHLTLKKIIKK